MSSPPYEPAGPGDTSPDAGEDEVRRALRDAVTGIEPSAWPAGAILGRAARLRRARRTALTVPVMAAVVACAGIIMTGGGDDPVARVRVVPAAPPTPPGPSTGPSPSPSPTVNWPPVRVVQPGKVLAIGKGHRMKLRPFERCVDQGDALWTCESVVDGNQAAGSVSVQATADNASTLYTPLYIGAGKTARMTVSVDGRSYPLRVVTLAGRPGFATGYGEVPGTNAITRETVTVYDAQGKVLATLP